MHHVHAARLSLCGIFLLIKAVNEIHNKLGGEDGASGSAVQATFAAVILLVIDRRCVDRRRNGPGSLDLSKRSRALAGQQTSLLLNSLCKQRSAPVPIQPRTGSFNLPCSSWREPMSARILLLLVAAGCLTACATGPAYYNDRPYDDRYSAVCRSCGTIEKIERVYGERQTTGGGAVLGAIIGGALGNQVGRGNGRKAATVAGAVAGGVIGNNIESDQRSAPRFEIFLRMDDGRNLVVEQPTLDDLRDGDRVELRNGRLWLQ